MQMLTRMISFIILHGRGIRRTLGIVLLGAAAAMAIIGPTSRDGFSPERVLAYWGTVFLLLFSTVLVAYLDLRAIRRDFRIQKKALFVTTFSDEEFKRKIREKHPELFAQKD
jgi:hypothetical protein